jgi:hypothetical protein
MDKLEVGGLAEGMLDARIKVGQGLEDVFSGQIIGDRLRHKSMIPGSQAAVIKI